MLLSILTENLNTDFHCTFNDMLCTEQEINLVQDASISFTTFLTAGSALLKTIYAAALSSLTLSSLKLCLFYNKNFLANTIEQRQLSHLDHSFNSSLIEQCSEINLENSHNIFSTETNTSPTHSEIVSITGALIVFTVLLATVFLTHLFEAIDDFTRKCRKIKISHLLNVGLAKNVQLFIGALNQLLLDLLITIVLKSSLLTSLFLDEKSLQLTKKLNYESNLDHDENDEHDDDDHTSETIELDQLLLNDEQAFANQRNWTTWFADHLKKRLIDS